MPYEWHGDEAKAELERLQGQVLIVCAIEVQSEMKRELSKSYPPASIEGEYPRGRTWNLREGVVYEPTDPAVAGKRGEVRIGYTKAAFYGAILETLRKRLGVKATVERLRTKIVAILATVRRQ